MFKKLSILTFVTFFAAPPCLHAGILRGDACFGLNYPGVSVKSFHYSQKYPIEVRAQFGTDIFVGGFRLYRYFKPVSIVHPFLGIETDYITFKGKFTKGDGFAGEIFAGGEYFISKKLSLQMDGGPAFIYLKDNEYPLSVSGIEYVANISINYYFL